MMFEIFKAKTKTAAQMREARAEIDTAKLSDALAVLQEKRRQALLSGTDAEVRKIDSEIDNASLALDRATVGAGELDRLIAEADAAESAAAFQAKYDAAVAARDGAMAKIDNDYARGAKLILGAIEAVNRANELVETVNREIYKSDIAKPNIEEADVMYWAGRFSTLETRIGRTALLPTHSSDPYGAPANPLFAASEGHWS